MNIIPFLPNARCLMVSATALALAACSGQHSYRLAAVGDVPSGSAAADTASTDGGSATGSDGGSGSTGGSTMGGGATAGNGAGGTGTGMAAGSSRRVPGGNVLVSAGNATMGLAGRSDRIGGRVNGLTPAATPVAGTVTRVINRTGQTLVDLGNGRTAVLRSARGTVGEVVTLDLGRRSVVGAGRGSSLLGVGVLSATPAQGSLGSVNVANGVPLARPNIGTGAGGVTGVVGAVTGGSVSGGGVAGPVTTALPATTPAATLPVVGSVTGTAKAGGGSQGVGGVLGVAGGLGKHK